jgi:hypothetical protein
MFASRVALVQLQTSPENLLPRWTQQDRVPDSRGPQVKQVKSEFACAICANTTDPHKISISRALVGSCWLALALA